MQTCFRKLMAVVVSLTFLLESNVLLAQTDTWAVQHNLPLNSSNYHHTPAPHVPSAEDRACTNLNFDGCYADSISAETIRDQDILNEINQEQNDFAKIQACLKIRFQENCKVPTSEAYGKSYLEFIRQYTMADYAFSAAVAGQSKYLRYDKYFGNAATVSDLERDQGCGCASTEQSCVCAHRFPWLREKMGEDRALYFTATPYQEQQVDFDLFFSNNFADASVTDSLDQVIQRELYHTGRDLDPQNPYPFVNWREQQQALRPFVEKWLIDKKAKVQNATDPDGQSWEEWFKSIDDKGLSLQKAAKIFVEEAWAQDLNEEELQSLENLAKAIEDHPQDDQYNQLQKEFTVTFPEVVSPTLYKVWWLREIQKEYLALQATLKNPDQKLEDLAWQLEYFTPFLPEVDGLLGRAGQESKEGFIKWLDSVFKVAQNPAVPAELSADKFPFIHLAAQHELWPYFWQRFYLHLQYLQGKISALPHHGEMMNIQRKIGLPQLIRDFGIQGYLGHQDINLHLFLRALLGLKDDNYGSMAGDFLADLGGKLGQQQISWSEHFWQDCAQSDPKLGSVIIFTPDKIRQKLREKAAWQRKAAQVKKIDWSFFGIGPQVAMPLAETTAQLMHLQQAAFLDWPQVEAFMGQSSLASTQVLLHDGDDGPTKMALVARLKDVWKKFAPALQDNDNTELAARLDILGQREYEVRRWLAFTLFRKVVHLKKVAAIESMAFLQELDQVAGKDWSRQPATLDKFAVAVVGLAQALQQEEGVAIPSSLQRLFDEKFQRMQNGWWQLGMFIGTLVLFCLAMSGPGIGPSLILLFIYGGGLTMVEQEAVEEFVDKPNLRADVNSFLEAAAWPMPRNYLFVRNFDEDQKYYTNEVLESFDQDLADRPYLRLTIEAALAFNLNAAAAGKTLTMLASVRAMPLMAKRLGWAKATGQALWRRAADKGLGYNPLLLYHFTKRPFAKRLLNPAKWDLRQIDEEGFEIVTQELAGPELTRRAAQKSAKIIGQQGLAFLERTIGRMAEAWPKDHLLPLARELKRLGHLSGRDLYEIEVFSRAAPFSRWGVLRRFTRQTLGKKKLPSDRLKKQVVAKVKEAIKRASHGEVDLFTAAQQGPSSLEAFLNNEANFSLFKTITKHAVGPWRETPYKFFMVGYSDLKTMDKAAWWVRVAKLQKACEAHTAARHLQIIQEKVGLQNAEQLNEFFRELSLAGGRPGPWVVQTLRHEELFPARLLKVLAQELRRVDGQGKLIYQNIYARPDIAKLILQDGDQIVFRPEFWNKLPRPMREAIFDRVAEQSGEEWLSWVYGSRMANAHKANFYF